MLLTLWLKPILIWLGKALVVIIGLAILLSVALLGLLWLYGLFVDILNKAY